MRGKKDRGCCGYAPDIVGYVSKSWGYFLGAVASNLLASAGAIGAPFLLAEALESYNNDNSPESHFFKSNEFFWTLGLGGAVTLYQGLYFLRSFFINASVIRLRKDISQDVLQQVLRLTYSENQSLESGEIHQRLGRLESTLSDMMSSFFHGTSALAELIASSLIVGEKYGLEFSLCLILIAAINMGSMMAMQALTNKPDAERIRSDEELCEIIAEIEAGYETIKGNSQEKYFEGRVINPKIVDWIQKSNKANCMNELLPMTKNIVVGLGITAISLRALHLLYTDRYHLDDLVFIVSYLIQIANSTSGADSLLKEFRISWRGFKKVMDILDRETEAEGNDKDYGAIQKIQFNQVRFFSQPGVPKNVIVPEIEYTENSPLFSDAPIVYGIPNHAPESLCLGPLSFELQKGQFTAIVGGSGTGKSTIARLIFRFLNLSPDPENGKIHIFFDGEYVEKDINHISFHNLRHKICYISQSAEILPGGLVQNVTFGDDEGDAHYWEALEKVDLLHEKSASTERLKKFSGGEKQRVNLARAFYAAAKGCSVFIFDESTAALDNTVQRKIMTKIHELKTNGGIVIFVAHRLEAIKEADQIICLKKEAIEDHKKVSKIASSGLWRSDSTPGIEKNAYDLMQQNCEEFQTLLNAECLEPNAFLKPRF
jgi:ABC-type multidrug transport system fused ATPase/permease subunit